MFDTLSEKFQKVFKTLKGEAKLTDANVQEALRDIRMALLEADVHFKVVKEFVDRVQQKCIGQEVMLALSPAQQVIKIVRDEMTEMLGSTASRLNFSNRLPSVVLITGLQGSGKTTSTGKIGRWLIANGHRPLLLSADVYRPAARDQLHIIARELNLKVFLGEGTQDPLELCRQAKHEATISGHDVLLIDTAGRLHIDEELMQELKEIKQRTEPAEILFVADAMTGQDAVKSAQEFHARLGITGVILTKLDGDARGGAALSIRSVTGQPIKFIGVGEKYDALELFHPDRLVSRILGMGDVLTLIEKAEDTFDLKQAKKLEEKIRKDEFTLEDFADQLRQLRKMGPLDQLLGLLPQIGPLKHLQKTQVDEKELVHIEAIINSMTPKERRHHQIINGQRRKRIAQGSGTSVQAVNRLLKQYAQMKKMMKSMKGGMMKGGLGKMKWPMPV